MTFELAATTADCACWSDACIRSIVNVASTPAFVNSAESWSTSSTYHCAWLYAKIAREMSCVPPAAARYRAAEKTASSAFHGSATPSPFASVPQRNHVSGMNCIHPIAPAELGPMLRPKFDSTLLIAASTCQGMPYAAPARCHTETSSGYGSCCGIAGAVVQSSGSAPVRLAVSGDGSDVVVVVGVSEGGTTTQVFP